MLEQTLTRHNALVDPTLHVWGWEIPVYLFLGGLVAGMMLITGYLQLTRPSRRLTCVCSRLPLVGTILITLGMLALLLDLEHKLYVWRLYVTFQPTSVMSWGAWILLLVYPALAMSALARPPEGLAERLPWLETTGHWFEARPSRLRLLGWSNIGLGIALGIYTGILLSTLGARPLWNSALLGPLFLMSGLSSAAAFVHALTSDADERRTMERADVVFLSMELALLFLMLVGLLTAARVHGAAAALVLGGPFTAVFWVLVVSLGIVAPLVIQSLVIAGRAGHTAAAPVLVLAGGLALRFVFVYAGQVSQWAARL